MNAKARRHGQSVTDCDIHSVNGLLLALVAIFVEIREKKKQLQRMLTKAIFLVSVIWSSPSGGHRRCRTDFMQIQRYVLQRYSGFPSTVYSLILHIFDWVTRGITTQLLAENECVSYFSTGKHAMLKCTSRLSLLCITRDASRRTGGRHWVRRIHSIACSSSIALSSDARLFFLNVFHSLSRQLATIVRFRRSFGLLLSLIVVVFSDEMSENLIELSQIGKDNGEVAVGGRSLDEQLRSLDKLAIDLDETAADVRAQGVLAAVGAAHAAHDCRAIDNLRTFLLLPAWLSGESICFVCHLEVDCDDGFAVGEYGMERREREDEDAIRVDEQAHVAADVVACVHALEVARDVTRAVIRMWCHFVAN